MTPADLKPDLREQAETVAYRLRRPHSSYIDEAAADLLCALAARLAAAPGYANRNGTSASEEPPAASGPSVQVAGQVTGQVEPTDEAVAQSIRDSGADFWPFSALDVVRAVTAARERAQRKEEG